MNLEPFSVLPAEAGHTLAKILRSRLHESQPSWADVRKLVEGRRVVVGESLCTDSARRLKEGELVTLQAQAAHRPRATTPDGLALRHLDDHVVVVEKASGLNTVRHPSELEWSEERKQLSPTLQDVVQWSLGQRLNRPPRSLPPLRIVHRLDKDTSGLLCFARSVQAERSLGMQFRKHTVMRRYLAFISGVLLPQTIRSSLVKDRGDGRRGSTKLPHVGKIAVTHIEVEERYPKHTLLSVRLETGRTHQIRIHLSEAGHHVCGDKVYVHRPNGEKVVDTSGAPRLALHATELGFEHPITLEKMHWTMPLPEDLKKWQATLR